MVVTDAVKPKEGGSCGLGLEHILNEGDLVSTCKKYVTLVRENHELPREYGTVRATLEGIQHGTAPQGTLHGKIGAVLSEMGKFQHAVFMLEYPSVGMSKAIRDVAGITFAAAFYQALGFGRDVRTAFDLGCVQIDLGNLGEQDTPKLLVAPGKDPRQIVLVQNRE